MRYQYFILTQNIIIIIKPLVSQEMLKEKIIASNVIYTSIFHKEENMKKYYNTLSKTFKKIHDCENQKRKHIQSLESDVCITNLRNEKNSFKK